MVPDVIERSPTYQRLVRKVGNSTHGVVRRRRHRGGGCGAVWKRRESRRRRPAEGETGSMGLGAWPAPLLIKQHVPY